MSSDPTIYLTHIEAAPTAGSAEHGRVKVADVLVFCADSSMESAQCRSLDFVISRGWVKTGVPATIECTPERVALMDELQRLYFHRAQKAGIDALFFGWPVHGNPKEPVRIYALQDKDATPPGSH